MQVTQFVSNMIYNSVYAQIDKIGEGLKQGRKQYVLVPDRFSLNMEKMVMESLNLVSTFDVEVLSFSRLANMVIGKQDKKVLGMLDATLIVEFLIKKNKDKLVCFNNMPITASFAKILFDSISQIKSCKISPEKLKRITKGLPNGNLRQKMGDIALVYELYENYIQEKFIDSNNKLGLLCEKLCQSRIFEGCDVHFSNFPDFSLQDYDIIENAIKCAGSVSITILSAEENQNNSDVYTQTVKTKIDEICEKLGITPQVAKCENQFSNTQRHISQQLFSVIPQKIELQNTKEVQLFWCDNMAKEIDFLVKNMLYLISQGASFGDFCIMVSDMNLYQNEIENVFFRYDIPFWMDKNIKLTDTAEYKFISSVFATIKWGFLPDDVLGLVFSNLSGLTHQEKELFYDVVTKFGVVGSMFYLPIKFKNDDEKLGQFEEIKLQFLKPVLEFKDKCEKSISMNEFCCALRELLADYNLEEKLSEFSVKLEQQGKLKESSIARQSHEKIVKILDQLEKVLGEEETNFDEWLDIFKAGIESTEIAPLPMGVDTTLVGQMLSTVFVPAKYVFVVGAVEGSLPAFIEDVGIISDQDIQIMEELNLSPTVKQLNQKSVLTVLQNMCLAQNLFVLMPQNQKSKETQKSRVITNLSQMFCLAGRQIPISNAEKISHDQKVFGDSISLNKFNTPTLEDMLKIVATTKSSSKKVKDLFVKYGAKDELLFIENGSMFDGKIKDANKLFFTDNHTKATQLERFFACPFLHFVEYGLKLKERQIGKIKPVDIGNILHELVEKFALYQKDKTLTDPQIEKFARQTFNKIIEKKNYQHLLFGMQNKALAKGLEEESIRICRAINFQNIHSKYKIAFVECSFGENFVKMPEIAVFNSSRKLKMRGKIDRIDIADKRFRVLDYKTGKGKSDFDMLDLYLGKKIQLFIYLYALKEEWKDKTPSGAFYFPIHNEFQGIKPTMPYQNYCLNGVTTSEYSNLILQDDQLSYSHPKSGIFGFGINATKAAEASGVLEAKEDANLVSQIQFNKMIEYSYQIFSKGLSEILEGYAQPKPFEGGCDYCLCKPFCPNFWFDDEKFRENNFEVKKTIFEEIIK